MRQCRNVIQLCTQCIFNCYNLQYRRRSTDVIESASVLRLRRLPCGRRNGFSDAPQTSLVYSTPSARDANDAKFVFPTQTSNAPSPASVTSRCFLRSHILAWRVRVTTILLSLQCFCVAYRYIIVTLNEGNI